MFIDLGAANGNSFDQFLKNAYGPYMDYHGDLGRRLDWFFLLIYHGSMWIYIDFAQILHGFIWIYIDFAWIYMDLHRFILIDMDLN